MSAAAPSPAPRRLRTTPYARRLARERGLPLDMIAGTGPGGRITGVDVAGFEPMLTPVSAPAQASAPAASVQSAPAPLPAATVPTASAIAITINFGAVQALLEQFGALGKAVSHEDIVLKATASAMACLPDGRDGCILLLRGKNDGVILAAVQKASLGGIAEMRDGASATGPAGLAVSFLGRPGVRPVAARLVDGAPMRLVVGSPDRSGMADGLLSYDPERIEDDAAAEFLAALKEAVETPLRLLV